MRAFVDREACIGCGACVTVASEVFALDDEGKAAVISDTRYEYEGAVRDAIEGCPTAAIRDEE